jgi:superfamily II DNA/RNA helicase
MKLKKLLPQLVENIIELGYDKEPREIQGLMVPKIKSGADLMVFSPVGSGRSTALNIGVIQQLKAKEEEAPRAIIVVANKERAFAMDEQFERLAKDTSLRSLIVYDEGHIDYQKEMIYDGIDVLIATPKRLKELISISGVPVVKLRMLIFDDADYLFLHQFNLVAQRIIEAVDKIQVITVTEQLTSKLEDFADLFMKNPQVIEFDE